MHVLRLLTAVLAAAVLAGCGGDSDQVATAPLPGSASITPADVAFYASLDTNFDGEQWQRLEALIDRFPSGDRLGEELRSSLADDGVEPEELKRVLGDEVAFAGWLPGGASEPRFVLYTRSPDAAGLKALLEQSDEPVVTAQVDGWTVAAERQADLDRLTGGGATTLAADDRFADAVGGLGEDMLLVAYAGGEALQRAVDEGAADEGVPPGLLKSFGSLEAIVAGVSAETDGIRFATLIESDGGIEPEAYDPSLDEALPARPLLYVSAASVDDGARQALETADDQPEVRRQLADFQRLLGLSIEEDVLPTLGGEVALAVYGEASGDLPVTVDLLLEVDDEDAARRLVDRLAALAQLSGSAETAQVTVAGLEATEIHLREQGLTILAALDDGTLVLTTSREGLEAIRAGTPRLADDDAYTAAIERAGGEDDLVGLVYSDLQSLVPLVMGFAGDDAGPEVQANLEPLRSAAVVASADGDDVTISGFVGID